MLLTRFVVNLIEDALLHQQGLVLSTFDIKKAFDSEHRTGPRALGIPDELPRNYHASTTRNAKAHTGAATITTPQMSHERAVEGSHQALKLPVGRQRYS
jgi:hypothetical protein